MGEEEDDLYWEGICGGVCGSVFVGCVFLVWESVCGMCLYSGMGHVCDTAAHSGSRHT